MKTLERFPAILHPLLFIESQSKDKNKSEEIRIDSIDSFHLWVTPIIDEQNNKHKFLPSSVGIDFTFHNNNYAYGLSERYHQYQV